MRRKPKSPAEMEKQFGGFIPHGIVRGQSKRGRTAPGETIETEAEPEPQPEAEPGDKAQKEKG